MWRGGWLGEAKSVSERGREERQNESESGSESERGRKERLNESEGKIG